MSNKELDDQYKNSKNSYEVFYDDEDETKVTQYRFHLEDDDPEIKNKHLCISKNIFIIPVILFYERHRTIGDKKIIEYYENDEMSISIAPVSSKQSYKVPSSLLTQCS